MYIDAGKLIVFFLAGGGVVYLALSCHDIALQIFIVSGNLIDHRAVRKKFDNAVGGCLHDLVVTAGEKNDARELDHAVI